MYKNANKLKRSDKVKDKTQYVSARYTNILPNILHNEFKKLGIIVSFRTTNKLTNILKPNTKALLEDCSGVYRIRCNECDKILSLIHI